MRVVLLFSVRCTAVARAFIGMRCHCSFVANLCHSVYLYTCTTLLNWSFVCVYACTTLLNWSFVCVRLHHSSQLVICVCTPPPLVSIGHLSLLYTHIVLLSQTSQTVSLFIVPFSSQLFRRLTLHCAMSLRTVDTMTKLHKLQYR